ncbi:MAG: transporter substrate-binding domain-containing protein [Verrucomicrobiales bacterium]
MFLRFSFLFLIGGSCLLAQAPEPSAAPPARNQKLTVLIKPAPPFVFEKNGVPAGYSIDLWKRIAEEAALEYEFKQVATVPDVIDGLVKKQADAGVGALSIIAEREDIIDFSHKFFDAGLQILARAQGNASVFGAFRKVIPEGLTVAGILLAALLVNAHILWLLERRRNPESFPEGYIAGVWEGIWWSVCTLITGSCENKTPIGVWGRLFAIVWMLAGIGLVAFVTARMASIMTYQTLTSDIRSLADLQGQPVATVTGSAAEEFLKTQSVTTRGYPDVDAACRALGTSEVRAVVYDQPLLRYYLTQNPESKLQLVGHVFERQNYGFAFQDGSQLREPINRALLKVGGQGVLDELDEKWFGSEKK